MLSVATRRESSSLPSSLDPHLFTFKPKLNQKSTQIAQNLLGDFYERQVKHIQRLQDFKEIAAVNYRQWYCHVKEQQQCGNSKSIAESKSTTTELLLTDDTGAGQTSLPLTKEVHPSNERVARLNRVYRSLFPSPIVPSSRRMSPSLRSKSPPKVVRQTDSSPKRSIGNETINTDRLKLAKDEAERAMKEHKIFTIIGPYPALREALRSRGWIEKFYRNTSLPSVHGSRKSDKKNNNNNKSDDDDDDDNVDELADDDLDEHPTDEDEDKIRPWEENDGYYGLLSRLVKTAAPNFIWSVRATYDTSTLSRDQMVNHYSRNGCFTTKVGLCTSLRNLQWFHSGCADEFYPRCYKLTHDDDKVAFVDDYRLSACISFLKLIQNRCKGVIEPDMNSILAMSSDNRTDPTPTASTTTMSDDEPQLTRSLSILPAPQLSPKGVNKMTTNKKVPLTSVEFALNRVTQYTLSRDHEDIDVSPNASVEASDEQWTQFIEHFYAASHSNGEIEGMEIHLSRIDECLRNVEHHWPQYHIDGTRNIWILKPGAKSRGRGIIVYDRLEDILKLCSSTLTKDNKFVVQKYIERPLLIHNTKFDIRQWFLVTDWNPLTIWMFKDCYLRFCTEHFSLETRQQNVHLCNYSIQKHYKNNSNRHVDLPVENMWTNKEFIEKYLKPNNLADRWETSIYPAMKDAIVCSMLVAQDTIDCRKNSFELFGADFMLGEDLKPWLIEINCSPTMARCTAVTTELCDSVLEDTCKVMIDRKYNRSADTGRFELIHRGQPVPVPTYIGIDLRVEGKPCKTGRMSSNSHSVTCGTQNNSNNNVIQTMISAPPPVSSMSSISTITETRSIPPQPASVIATQPRQSPPTSHTMPALKLRREMTQPTLTRVEVISSTDAPLETLANNDNFSFPLRSNSSHVHNKLYRHQQSIPLQSSDIRQKQLKITSTRISVDCLPVRQVSRSKVNDRLPSPKGNSTKNTGVSKINVSDFLFTGKGVKLPHQPIFHRFPRTWLAYNNQQHTTVTNNSNSSKILHRNKTTLTPSILPLTSTISIPSTISTFSRVDNSDGHSVPGSSILLVV